MKSSEVKFFDNSLGYYNYDVFIGRELDYDRIGNCLSTITEEEGNLIDDALVTPRWLRYMDGSPYWE